MDAKQFIMMLSPTTVKDSVEAIGSPELFEDCVNGIIDIISVMGLDNDSLDENQCEFILALYLNGYVQGMNDGLFADLGDEDLFS